MSNERFHVPNLINLCGDHFELRVNKYCKEVSTSSLERAKRTNFLSPQEVASLPDLQLSLLASLCYPTCDVTQLGYLTNFILLLLHWSNRFCAASAQAFESIWKQVVRETPLDWQNRFQTHLRTHRDARLQVNQDRQSGIIPSLATYKTIRRDSSGLMMAFDYIEYVARLRLPDSVHESPQFMEIKNTAHDIVMWANDISSYNLRQSLGDHHNLVAVIMKEEDCSLQIAVDSATDLLKAAIEKFLNLEKALPSWSPEIDEDVDRYVQGLRDWIVGSIHWIYETGRYFDGNAEDVRTFGWVFLLPKQSTNPEAAPAL
ncbi:terpenoid synthase [Panus rudis PR-1116 ss-1]|nr:terpenoid synthase [Panus rudis PR-1116 ss-1]